MRAASREPMTDQLIATRIQQSLYAAASRHLGQLSGAVLLLLADRSQQRLTQHLPAIKRSAMALDEHLSAADLPTASRVVLKNVQARLATVLGWLNGITPAAELSDRDVSTALTELQNLRQCLISAGEQSCRFSMVQFAAGCCCGQHKTTSSPGLMPS